METHHNPNIRKIVTAKKNNKKGRNNRLEKKDTAEQGDFPPTQQEKEKIMN